MKSKKEFLMISPNFKFESKVQMNLGEIALGENKYSTALGYYQSILNDKDFSKNDIKKSALLLNIGLCYFHLNQISVAENFYFKSLAIQQKQKDTSFLISSYINIANLYYEQYKDKEAIYYFKKAYESAANVTDPQLKQMTAFNMAVVEENRGEIVKAMHYRKEFENWNDSLHNQNKVWEIAELEKRFAIQQKQKKINLLSIENRAKNAERNGFFFASLLLLGTLFSGIYFYRLKIHKNKIIENQRNELDQLNATKDKLLSIVSHDLRSSVNALKNSNQKILRNFESNNYDEMGSLLLRNANITNSSYNLLDNILHWAQQQNEQLYFQQEDIHLSKIVDQVIFNYKYILLEKEVTFSNKIPIETLVFCDIDSLKIVFRNLIDNAIKFSKIGGQISMYLLNNQIDDFVCFAIEDTGCGMPQEVLDKLRLNHHLLTQKNNKEIIGTGLGFQLCKSMLKKNNGEITLIESKLNIGTKIIINLPKQKKNE
ncbi:MAG: tetratricopeptide repeat-containing sensor histidine kinase [Flavobacteriia bacterium]|nr:tetratricopeptide repeat-containing sensor histidine kinase [Flavobacteriia bacterium]